MQHADGSEPVAAWEDAMTYGCYICKRRDKNMGLKGLLWHENVRPPWLQVPLLAHLLRTGLLRCRLTTMNTCSQDAHVRGRAQACACPHMCMHASLVLRVMLPVALALSCRLSALHKQYRQLRPL